MTRASPASVSRPRSRALAHLGRNRVTSTRAEPPIRRVDRASDERASDRASERTPRDGRNERRSPGRAVVSTAALARRRLARAHDDTRAIVVVVGVDKTPGCGFFTTMKRHDTRGWERDRVFHMSEPGVLFFMCVRDRRSVILGMGRVPVSNAMDAHDTGRSSSSRAIAMTLMID